MTIRQFRQSQKGTKMFPPFYLRSIFRNSMDTKTTNTKHDSLVKKVKLLQKEISDLKNSLATEVLTTKERVDKTILIQQLELMIVKHAKDSGV